MEMHVCVGLDKRPCDFVADSHHLSEDNVRPDKDPFAGLAAHLTADDVIDLGFPIYNVSVVLTPFAGQEKSSLVPEGNLQSAKYEARGGGRGAFCVSLNSTCFALTRSAHLHRYGPPCSRQPCS